jgi:hypothetical protein
VIQLASRENLTMIPTTIAYRKASGGASRYRTTPIAKRNAASIGAKPKGLKMSLKAQ